jgi:hypothetical protein
MGFSPMILLFGATNRAAHRRGGAPATPRPCAAACYALPFLYWRISVETS